jgi:hypothetical protein
MVIKSAILTHLNRLTGFRGEATGYEAPLDQVLLRFERRYGTLRWLRASSVSRRLFLRNLSDALRHKSSDRYSLAAKVVEQALNGGIEQALSGVSPESKRLLLRAKEVRLHRRLLETGTHLFPKGRNSLIGFAECEHLVGELVAYSLAKRNPGKRVILTTPTACYQASRGELITITDPNICRTLRHEALELVSAELYWRKTFAAAKKA